MAWVEDLSKRGQKYKHFYDAFINKWMAEFTIHDRHYKDDNNNWQDLDETIINDGVDGFDKKCEKTRHTFRVKSGGAYRWYPRRNVSTEYAEITEIQYYTNRWRTLNLPAAVWKSQGAEWDMTNLYASITNTWNRIKTDFILKNSSAYTRLRFAITFVGLTYNDTTGALTSTTDGLVWGYIPKPTAHYGTEPDVVNVPITQTYTGGYIEWQVDTTGATFPIYIDPTFQDGAGGTINSNIDTNINSQNHTTNYGTTVYQDVGFNGTYIFRGLMKFGIDSGDIPAGSSITSATLTLVQYYEGIVAGTYTYRVYRQLRAWVEAEATWDIYSTGNNWTTDGGFDATDCEQSDIGNFTIANDTGTRNISLTASAIQEMITGGTFTNNGFLIKSDTESVNTSYVAWRSSDYGTEADRPKLVVVYEAEANVNVSDSIAVTDTPTVQIEGESPATLEINICPANNWLVGVRIYP